MSNISFSLQKKGNSPFKSPSAFQLRALVLDYLCHHCYTNTAGAFLQDSTVKELDADGDEILSGTQSSRWPSSPKETPELLLKQVEQRRELRELILAGQVGDAIERLNKYFPSVLSETSSSQLDGAASSNNDGSFTYVSKTSVEPAHLFLNLRILAFIESCRTRPMEIPPPKVISWSRTSATPFSKPIDTATGGENPSRPDPVSEIDPELLVSLLARGRKLYALANALPSVKDKELYRKELENVGGLLAYKVPEESPVAKYLSYERREAVADQVNRATLYRSGHSSISSIELLARYTTVVWQTAKAQGARPRPDATLPPTSPRHPATGAKADELEEVPLFDLKQFLESKP